MWLLDANMDVHLVSVLTGFQISCDTAGQRGWKSLSNGELVRAAVDLRDRKITPHRPRYHLQIDGKTLPRGSE
jgi:hypothetical protein